MKLIIHNSKMEIPEIKEIALVIGDGRTLHDDMNRFLSWKIPHDVMSIGRSINQYPGDVMHWVNVDGEDSKWWAEHLPLKFNGRMPVRHTLGDCEGYDIDWDVVDNDGVMWDPTEVVWHGSSSLFAVHIGLAMGYRKIVLAGCPLDSKGHWFCSERYDGPKWTAESYIAWLEFAKTEEAKRVRSLSGYTAQIIGMAEKEFLNGLQELRFEREVGFYAEGV